MSILADGGASLPQQSATRASCEHHRFNSISEVSAGFGAHGLRVGQAPRHACILEVVALTGPQHGSGLKMLGRRSYGRLRPSR